MVDFNLENLLTQQETQVTKTVARQEKELQTQAKQAQLTQQAAAQTRVVADQASASLQASNEERLQVLGGIDEELRRANVAIELAQSDNPLDRLQLWALQQTSKSYTREGNAARIGYYTQAAEALGYTEQIRQSGYSDKLAQIQADLANNMLVDNAELEMLKLMETQGQELIGITLQNQQDALTAVTQNHQLQQAALDGLTDEQLAATLELASQNPEGSASVSGVPVTAQNLKQQQDARTERQFLVTQREYVLDGYTTQTLMMPEVEKAISEATASETGIAVVKGREIPLSRLIERRDALTGADADRLATMYQTSTTLNALDMQAQERIITTFSPARINTIIANGGVDQDGSRYDIPTLERMRESKIGAQTQLLQDQATQAVLSAPGAPAAAYSSELDSVQAQPGSPLAEFVQTQRTVNNVAAGFLSSDDPLRQQYGLETISAGRAALNEQINAEASRMAMGDKNKEMALQYQLRGQAIPPTLIRDALLQSVTGDKQQSVANWVPRELAAQFEQVYQDQMRQLNDVTNKENLMSPMDKNEKKRYAASMAIEAVTGKAMAPITQEFATFQIGQQSNPLHSVFKDSPAEFLTMNAEADRLGAAAYQQDTQMSNEDLANLMANGGNMDLDAYQYSHLLMLLEQKKPGLAESYVKWWQSDSRRQTTAAYDAMKQERGLGNFQEAAAWGLAREQLDNQFERTATLFQEGLNVMFGQKLRAQHNSFITFGGDPRLQQAYLLQNTPTLNDSERSVAMSSIIQPLIQETVNQKMNEQDASAYIERQLMTMTPIDATQGSLLRKIRAERTNAMNTLTSFYELNDFRNVSQLGAFNPIGQLFHAIPWTRNMPMQAETGRYGWLHNTPQ